MRDACALISAIERVEPTDSYYENVSDELKRIVTEVMDSPSDEQVVVPPDVPPTDTLDSQSCEYLWFCVLHSVTLLLCQHLWLCVIHCLNVTLQEYLWLCVIQYCSGNIYLIIIALSSSSFTFHMQEPWLVKLRHKHR